MNTSENIARASSQTHTHTWTAKAHRPNRRNARSRDVHWIQINWLAGFAERRSLRSDDATTSTQHLRSNTHTHAITLSANEERARSRPRHHDATTFTHSLTRHHTSRDNAYTVVKPAHHRPRRPFAFTCCVCVFAELVIDIGVGVDAVVEQPSHRLAVVKGAHIVLYTCRTYNRPLQHTFHHHYHTSRVSHLYCTGARTPARQLASFCVSRACKRAKCARLRCECLSFACVCSRAALRLCARAARSSSLFAARVCVCV